MTRGEVTRDVRQIGQSRKHQRIVNSYTLQYITGGFTQEIKQLFRNPSLEFFCDYCGITSEKLLTDLEKYDFRKFLVMGTCMFEK